MPESEHVFCLALTSSARPSITGSLGWEGRAWQPGPIPQPQPGAGKPGRTGGSPSPRHWASLWGAGQAEVRLEHGSVGGPSSVVLMAVQGCGELETCPAVASLGQGLTSL